MLALTCAHTLISDQSDDKFSDVRKNELTYLRECCIRWKREGQEGVWG